MSQVAGIKLNHYDMPIFFDPQDVEIELDDYCVVENPFGEGEKTGFVAAFETRCHSCGS